MSLDTRKAKAMNWARSNGHRIKFAFGHVWARINGQGKYKLVHEDVYMRR